MCWCYVVVWLGWCGIRMQAPACTLCCCRYSCTSVSCPSVPQYCDTINLRFSCNVRLLSKLDALIRLIVVVFLAPVRWLQHTSCFVCNRSISCGYFTNLRRRTPRICYTSHNLCIEMQSARRRIVVWKTASKRATAGMYRNLIIRNGSGYLLATKCGNARRNILAWL